MFSILNSSHLFIDNDRLWTYAVQSKASNIVDIMLPQVNVNQPDVEGKTALDYAPDCHGFAPLHWAALSGNKAAVDVLLATKEMDIRVKSSIDETTPLHLAVLSGHKDVAERLIEKAGETIINEQDKAKNTPLELAFKVEQYDCFSYMLRYPKAMIGKKLTLQIAKKRTFCTFLLRIRCREVLS